MQSESMTHKTLRNVSYSLVGYLWPIIFSVFVTPFIVFSLGVNNYGFFVLLGTVNSILGLLDFGVSTAAIKYMAEYSGSGDKVRLQKLIGSANLLFLVTGVAGFLVLAAAGLLSYGRLGLEVGQARYYIFFLISGLAFFVNSSVGLIVNVPSAVQRLDVSNKLGMVKLLLLNLTIVAFLLFGGGLLSMLSVSLFYDVVFLVVNLTVAKRLMPGVSFCPSWDTGEIKRCYKFGLTYFVSSWANSLLYQLDRLLIPFFLGPAQLAYYSLPGNVATRIQGLNNSLSAIVFPMSSSYQGSGDNERLRTIYIRSSRLLIVVAVGITVSMIPFAGRILTYWLDADFAAKSTRVLVILALTHFFLALASPINQFLMGLGRVRLLVSYSVSMTAINAVALWLLMPRFGIEGAAYAYLVAVLPVAGLYYYTEKHVLGLSGRLKVYAVLAMKNLLCSLIVFAAAKLILVNLAGSLLTVAMMFGVTIVLYFILYAAFGFFEREDLLAFRDFLNSAFRKMAGIWRKS